MKPWSKRRKLRWKEVEQWRDRFRLDVGRCEMCLKPASPEHLDVHECVIGALRQQALDRNFATLCLHRRCHTIMETLTIPHQLAYLLRSRPDDFNLEAYYNLTDRKWPDLEAILIFYNNLV